MLAHREQFRWRVSALPDWRSAAPTSAFPTQLQSVDLTRPTLLKSSAEKVNPSILLKELTTCGPEPTAKVLEEALDAFSTTSGFSKLPH